MPRIFISYRRADTAGYAGRLHDALSVRFGDEEVFRDISDLAAGVDFVQALEQALASTAVALVVIGERWLETRDGHSRRIDDPDDFVRLEVQALLQRSLRVIPVLIQDARMPAVEALPLALQPLARRQARRLRDDDPRMWEDDVWRLGDLIESVLAPPAPAPTGPPPAAPPAPPATPTPGSGVFSMLDRWLRPVNPLTLMGMIVALAIIIIAVRTVLDASSTTTPSTATQPVDGGWIIVLGADTSYGRAQFEVAKLRGQGFPDGKVYHWRQNPSADWLWIPTVGPYPREEDATRDQPKAAKIVDREVDVQPLQKWCGGQPLPNLLSGYDKDGYDECPY